jgi:hypothetical protein
VLLGNICSGDKLLLAFWNSDDPTLPPFYVACSWERTDDMKHIAQSLIELGQRMLVLATKREN